MSRIVCLAFPHWPIQRLVVAKPELKGQAVVLYAIEARRVRRVVASSRAAWQLGIRPPMLLTDAVIQQRGVTAAPASDGGPAPAAPSWHWQLHDPAADQQALAGLADFSQRYSPLVGWSTAGAIAGTGRKKTESSQTLPFAPGNCLFWDITGVSRWFGGEPALAAQALAEFSRLGYRPRLAVADTIGAAWAIARYGPSDEEQASRIVPPGETRAALAELPLEALRLSSEKLGLLHQLGLLRIEQLLALPRSSLAARLGPEPLWRWDQALGEAPEAILAYRPPPQYEAHAWLEHPTARRAAIEQIVAQLLAQVSAALTARHRGALQLICRLDCAAQDPLRLTIGLFRASARVTHWMELVRMQFEQAALPGAVQRISVEAVQTAPLEQYQTDLFAGDPQAPSRESDRQLATLVNRLSSRLGAEAVVQPRPSGDPQPERAYEDIPLTTLALRPSSAARQAPPPPQAPTERPLWLYHPPRPLEVVAVAPDGPPRRVQGPDLRFEITRFCGPQRIETGWWRGSSVRRDYYQVESHQGTRYWIFRRLSDGQWFLQGEFI